MTAEADRGYLGSLFASVEKGDLPPANGAIQVVPQPSPDQAAVVAFTAHILIVADVEPEWVARLLPPGDLSEPLNPPFLSALCKRLACRVNSSDMVMYAPVLAGEPPLPLRRLTDTAHPRVERAHKYRSKVEVWAAGEDGVMIGGRGLAGRWETAFEVEPERQGRGLGRQLALAARHLAPAGVQAVWAQVAPGNAASVRTLLAAGYRPVGSEALLVNVAG